MRCDVCRFSTRRASATSVYPRVLADRSRACWSGASRLGSLLVARSTERCHRIVDSFIALREIFAATLIVPCVAFSSIFQGARGLFRAFHGPFEFPHGAPRSSSRAWHAA